MSSFMWPQFVFSKLILMLLCQLVLELLESLTILVVSGIQEYPMFLGAVYWPLVWSRDWKLQMFGWRVTVKTDFVETSKMIYCFETDYHWRTPYGWNFYHSGQKFRCSLVSNSVLHGHRLPVLGQQKSLIWLAVALLLRVRLCILIYMELVRSCSCCLFTLIAEVWSI